MYFLKQKQNTPWVYCHLNNWWFIKTKTIFYYKTETYFLSNQRSKLLWDSARNSSTRILIFSASFFFLAIFSWKFLSIYKIMLAGTYYKTFHLNYVFKSFSNTLTNNHFFIGWNYCRSFWNEFHIMRHPCEFHQIKTRVLRYNVLEIVCF